jgi:pyruvate,water dikinase
VAGDPISRRLLALTLLDPASGNFRPSGCKSAHDVLRYCHEKAIEAMFDIGDFAMEMEVGGAKELETSLPFNLLILDLGGGLSTANPGAKKIPPADVVSRPFQSLWQGISHSGVSWTREMPASFGDLASVLAQSFTPRGDAYRPLGEKSYLLVAEEYMNLNSRLAYHFSLVDACLCDVISKNYISFRFEGGGATPNRRSLRACFIEACLKHYGFQVDRRGDLVNAWFRKGSAAETGEKLDLMGRLLACSSQLDMYMTSHEVMRWYVRQFLAGNYSFNASGAGAQAGS